MSERTIRGQLARMIRRIERLEQEGAAGGAVPRFPVVIGVGLAAAIAASCEPTPEYEAPSHTGETTTTTTTADGGIGGEAGSGGGVGGGDSGGAGGVGGGSAGAGG